MVQEKRSSCALLANTPYGGSFLVWYSVPLVHRHGVHRLKVYLLLKNGVITCFPLAVMDEWEGDGLVSVFHH